MSSALSVALRERVVHAVEAGASRHQAAELGSVWRARAAGAGSLPARATSHLSPWVAISAGTGLRLMPA